MAIKSFDQNNCVIAENPAKIVKGNIAWSRQRPQQYLDKINLQKR